MSSKLDVKLSKVNVVVSWHNAQLQYFLQLSLVQLNVQKRTVLGLVVNCVQISSTFVSRHVFTNSSISGLFDFRICGDLASSDKNVII